MFLTFFFFFFDSLKVRTFANEIVKPNKIMKMKTFNKENLPSFYNKLAELVMAASLVICTYILIYLSTIFN